MPSVLRKRRRATFAVRNVSCRFCNFPISQRHHELPVSIYGETAWVIELCARCHESVHIFTRAYEDILAGKEDSRNIKLMLKLRNYYRYGSDSRDAFRIEQLSAHVTMAYNQQHKRIPPLDNQTWEGFFEEHDRREEERLWRL